MVPTPLLLLLGVLAVQGIKVQCEYEPNTWKPNQRFFLNDREVLVPTIYGLNLVIDDKDGTVSNSIKVLGTWEAQNMRAMAKLVKEGDTILNIGAHIGIEAIVLGKGLGPKGRLFIFEPTELTFPMLVKNIYLNELEDITIAYKMGASNATSKGISEVNTGNTGGARINTDPNFKPPAKPKVTYYTVLLDRVDNVLPKEAIVDFVLIDVESMQVYALQGMEETIARSPNMIIMCEWWGWYFKRQKQWEKLKQLDELVKSMHERKFKFYYLAPKKGNCNDIQFNQLSLAQVLAHTLYYLDIFYVPAHIDPNKL